MLCIYDENIGDDNVINIKIIFGFHHQKSCVYKNLGV